MKYWKQKKKDYLDNWIYYALYFHEIDRKKLSRIGRIIYLLNILKFNLNYLFNLINIIKNKFFLNKYIFSIYKNQEFYYFLIWIEIYNGWERKI